MRYEVHVNDVYWDDLYYNMRGYCGTLPIPGGGRLTIGERGITEYRRTAARLNREGKGI